MVKQIELKKSKSIFLLIFGSILKIALYSEATTKVFII